MTKREAIAIAKTFRKDADELLQRMKDHRKQFSEALRGDPQFDKELENGGEAIAQHTISIRDLESAIMRQGMTLKCIGNPTPYPNSYDPKSPVIDPTADGLKL